MSDEKDETLESRMEKLEKHIRDNTECGVYKGDPKYLMQYQILYKIRYWDKDKKA